MTEQRFLSLSIFAALDVLPSRMTSDAAAVQMLATALQESQLIYRRQVRGPARSFYQFERSGLIGVMRHRSTSAAFMVSAQALGYYQPSVEAAHDAIEHNDALAGVAARLLLWTLPQALPEPDDTGACAREGWAQYLEAWRPGRPRPEKWRANWSRAVAAVATMP